MAPCSACQKAKVPAGEERPKCIVSALSGRCSECYRKNLSHCDVRLTAPEWTKFRNMRDQLRAELENADDEEVEILQEQRRLDRQRQDLLDRLISHKAKTRRLKKQLRLASDRTDKALAREIEEDDAADGFVRPLLPDEVVVSDDFPAFHDILEHPIAEWESLFPGVSV